MHNDYAVATSILKILGMDTDLIEYVDYRQANDRIYLMNTAKVRSLGWRPAVIFVEGLAKTVQWYRETFDLWERSIPYEGPAPR